jgi:predicted Zn-dependent peptidase
LFNEVRQKRALCYSVHAGYSAGRDYGIISAYAGTTPQRAQETLDVTISEFRKLYGGSTSGASEDEFKRAIIGLKSHLVMQGESTSARAGALANDIFRIGRPRPLTELAERIDGVTLDKLNDYLATRELGPMTIASIGPHPLTEPNA